MTKEQALLRVDHALNGFRAVLAQDLTDSQRAAIEYHLPRMEKIRRTIAPTPRRRHSNKP